LHILDTCLTDRTSIQKYGKGIRITVQIREHIQVSTIKM